jgi:hypothetical protein
MKKITLKKYQNHIYLLFIDPLEEYFMNCGPCGDKSWLKFTPIDQIIQIGPYIE